MSNERATTITDTDRVEWLLRYGCPMQIDGGPIDSRAQVDEQIRKSRMRIGRKWEGSVAQSDTVAGDEVPEVSAESRTPKRMSIPPLPILPARTAEHCMISAGNRQLAIFIGDLRLRRGS